MWAARKWTGTSPIRRNDVLRTTPISKTCGASDPVSRRAIQQIYHVEFLQSGRRLSGRADSWVFRTERDAARESGQQVLEVRRRGATFYTDAEIAEIYDYYAKEEVRGARTRYSKMFKSAMRYDDRGRGPMPLRLHCVRAGLGWPLYSGEQTAMEDCIEKHPARVSRTGSVFPDCPERVLLD